MFLGSSVKNIILRKTPGRSKYTTVTYNIVALKILQIMLFYIIMQYMLSHENLIIQYNFINWNKNLYTVFKLKRHTVSVKFPHMLFLY